mgnify:CR=1 FL=1
MRSWSIKDSAELYQTANWGAGFFGINEKGHVQVTPRGPEGAAVDLYELLPSLQARGLRLPLLVRFSDIVSSRVRGLAKSFAKAIGDIARAKGMSQVAREARMSRESLYKALSGDRSPAFDTIIKVLGALGLKLHAEPA